MSKLLSYSSVFIAINAAILAVFYGGLLGSVVIPRVLVIGLATFACYNLVQLGPLRKRAPLGERNTWIFKRRKGLWIMTGIALLCVSLVATQLSLYDWINFGHLFLLALLYESIFDHGPLRKPLRKIPYTKPFFIAYIWTMSCAFPALYDLGFALSATGGHLWILPECFFFISGLAMLFDLRDANEDKRLGVKTFPTQLGPKRAKMIAGVFLFLSLALLFKNSLETTALSIWSLALYAAAVAAVATMVKNDSPESGFLYGVDGLIGLKGLLLLAAWPQ